MRRPSNTLHSLTPSLPHSLTPSLHHFAGTNLTNCPYFPNRSIATYT
jgi:hypothetical protein